MLSHVVMLTAVLWTQSPEPVAVLPVVSKIPETNTQRLTARVTTRLGQSGTVGCLLQRAGDGYTAASAQDCPRCKCADPNALPRVAVTTAVERLGTRTMVTVRAVGVTDGAVLWATSEKVGALNVEGAMDAAVDALGVFLRGSGTTVGDTGSSGGLPRPKAAPPATPAPGEKGSSGGKPAR